MNIRPWVRKLRRMFRQHEPLITVSISRENLLGNLRAYRAVYPDMRLAPVLKSNAYGHGLAVIAELLDQQDIAFFMVDSLYEAKTLRRAGIGSRIVVMGYVRPESIITSTLRDVDFAVTDLEQLRELAEGARYTTRIHLKLDTGMHRQGILPEDLPEAIELIRSNPRLALVGVATHLADADNEDEIFTRTQLQVWDTMLASLTDAFPSIEFRHASATKGARFEKGDVLRLGMGLYGYDTSGQGLALKPVLSMRSFIASLREIPKGESVGYGATFKANRPSRIATVPAGYYEGVDRGLSNVGSLTVNGMPCPIIGRVSMNMTSIDVTDLPEERRGDLVTLISRAPEDPNSALSMAKLAGTTPYVILTHIPGHLYRTVE